MIFLDRDTVDSLPFLVASMISTTPETVHPFLLKTLCFHVLPASVGQCYSVSKNTIMNLKMQLTFALFTCVKLFEVVQLIFYILRIECGFSTKSVLYFKVYFKVDQMS
jgi:hypothetical protein